jgi:hypothetical protein
MMKCEFVGGSKDGEVMEIHPSMNYRLRFPVGTPVVAVGKEPALDVKLTCEEYEYGVDRRYHFIGYIQP